MSVIIADNGNLLDVTVASFSYIPTTNCFIVDSIDGVAPTSNSDLYDKLIALL